MRGTKMMTRLSMTVKQLARCYYYKCTHAVAMIYLLLRVLRARFLIFSVCVRLVSLAVPPTLMSHLTVCAPLRTAKVSIIVACTAATTNVIADDRFD